MKKNIIAIVVSVVVVGGLVVWGIKDSKTPGKYDALATCIADSGAQFYGTFWCPHCANQKKMFGKSAKLLPYVECSTPDGKNQLPLCTDAGITGYPTWRFADGSELVGEITPDVLAEKTMCPLPAIE